MNPFIETTKLGFMNNFALWNVIKNTEATWQHKYRYLRNRYLALIEQRKEQMGRANPTNKVYRIMADKLTEREHQEFERTLREFVNTARGASVGMLVVMFPDSIQLGDAHLQAVNRYVKGVTGRIGVPFLDLTPILEQEEDHASLYLFPHDAHNSPKGLRLVAEAIADKLEALG